MTTINSTMLVASPYFDQPSGIHNVIMALYPPEVGCIASSFLDPFAFDVYALPTDIALAYHARALVEGMAIQIVGFQLGSSGYNPSITSQPLPVDPTATSLISPVYEGNITSYETASNDGTIISYTCSAPYDLESILGEVALIAEIKISPLNPAEEGTRYLFAIAHTSMTTKVRNTAVTFRVLLRG